MKKFDIIIIGGGAAGMMAAYSSNINKNKKVLILEKNEKLGKKLYITGKGRCNITNNRDISEFIDMITINPNFMYSSLYNFTNKDLIRFLNNQGLKTKVERGQRVFPASDKSSDVIKSFVRSLKNVKINLNENVQSLNKDKDQFIIKTNKASYKASLVILATGGITYPSTGSTGDGYKFARSLGHNIIQPRGSLLGIELEKNNLNLVSGLTVKNAQLNLYINGRKDSHIFGDFLFTHKGISGPIVLSLSDKLVDLDPKTIDIYCDFKPKVAYKELEARLLKDIEKSPKLILKNLLVNYFPKSLAQFLLINSDLDERMKLHEITRERRKDILNLMKNYYLSYKTTEKDSLGVITKGGVDTLEIDPSSLESKLIDNLFFAGEVIDVSAMTGGYNLQIAFSTGYLAGQSANNIINS